MRVIENSIISSSRSPIKGLLQDLHLAIINIASERAAEFNERFESFTIEYVDDDDFIASVQTESKHIKVSTGAIELLWVFAYVHFQYYTKVIQRVDFAREIEITSDDISEINPAIELLDWAMQRHSKHLEWKRSAGQKPEKTPWPTHLPSPLSSSDDSSDEGVATELARGSFAVLIHHELAHIALGHSGPSEIDPERDADIHSWDWILDSNQTVGDAAKVKRILVLINANMVGVAVDIRLKTNALISHPRNIDRLSNLLARSDLGPNDVAYAFTLSILQFHFGFTNHPFATPGTEYQNFRDAFDAIADHISKFETVTR